MFLARRNLFHDKTRLLLSAIGLALAVMLILLLNGIQDGIFRQLSAYYDHTPGSLVVVQEGITSSLGSSSLLPSGTTDSVQQTADVARVIPILSQYFFLDLHDRKVTVLVIGYDPQYGGGPWQLIEGREPIDDREVVFDRVLAQRHDITVGDEIAVMGLNFRVVGLSDGTASIISNYVFVLKSTIESLLFSPEITSSIFVTPADGITPEMLRDRLTEFPGVDVLLKTDVITNNERLFDRLFGAPIRLMVGIAFLVGTLVVGLVIYTASIERQREYGVLKAIGVRNQMLYSVVITQSLFAAIAGAVIGIPLTWAAAQLIMALRPEFLVTLRPTTVLFTLLASLVMALLAAFFPTRMMAGLAPAEVFRR